MLKTMIFGVCRPLALLGLALALGGCATPAGDELLQLPAQARAAEEDAIVARAREGVAKVLAGLEITGARKAFFENFSPQSVILDESPLELTRVDNQLVIAGAKTDIAFATNSIIIARDSLHISHGANNFIVCAADVDISHDGSMAEGSLVITRGRVDISHARNTLVYAVEGVEISHANNVRAFNTRDRKTSWGHINNAVVEPLFREEASSSH